VLTGRTVPRHDRVEFIYLCPLIDSQPPRPLYAVLNQDKNEEIKKLENKKLFRMSYQ
jgi:hypothetical protein